MSFGPPPSIYTQSALAAESQKKKRRRRALLLSLLVVALVAALGTGGWLLWGGPDAGAEASNKTKADAPGRLDIRDTVEQQPASTNGKMGFRFSVDDLSPGESYESPGMWATDKILAKGINRTLVGLTIGTDASPGKEKWKLRLDGPICGYTRHVTGDNRTAVLHRVKEVGEHEEKTYCNHVTFVDLDNGREIWSHEFPVSKVGGTPGAPSSGNLQESPSVTLTHGTVAVTWGGGTVAYDMDHGRTRWSTKAAGVCQDAGAAGGGALLVEEECWNRDKSLPVDSHELITYKVRKVDPATGRTLWTHSEAKGVRSVAIPSTDPAVIAVAAGDIGFTELISLDADGRDRAIIRLQQGTYTGECSSSSEYVVIDDCPTIAVGAGQVFLRSEATTDGASLGNWIIGFDLATGNSTRKFESGTNSQLYPVRMSGDQLLALRDSEDRITPTALVSLDPKTGKETPYFYFGLPAEAEKLTSTDFNDIVVENGRLFFGAKSVSGPGANEPKWVYLVLGIESAAAKKPQP
ncbi:PQQ-binding-like beta-propeller repeat protein [Streptomyces sp. BK239]|uniref:outer membrane protein assembly factor BamB family protein n=1 Tax=Streptomyces sp. BK239 TaxID=2512155 RepID=UPI0010E35ACE|nr:PQQ-binding-like beta-propeller repeat protein [Streptomyces sp. BK239]RZU10813.1 putative pyrroloquinoline-quinone binding quinoprotein [Streptomyces sp. BK239]